MKFIDPHIHFIDPAVADYAWLSATNPPFWPNKAHIQLPALPEQLQTDAPLSLAGLVHIEAGFDNLRSWREIEWLERLHTPILRAVGCVDLLDENYFHQVDTLCRYGSCTGVRDILDDEADTKINRAGMSKFEMLANKGLIFEAQLNLLNEAGVQALCRLAQQVKELRIVINHVGLNMDAGTPWQKSLEALSDCDNICVKWSGLEMSSTWLPHREQIRGLSFVREQFGDLRVMLASNFPVLQMAMSYQQYWSEWAQLLEPHEFELLAYQNAKSCYGFNSD